MHVPQLDLSAYEGVPFPVATVRELRRSKKLSVEGMGRQILLLWNAGSPRAYDDVCPHLGLPLSMGTVEKDRVRCRYHAWAFHTEDGSLADQPTLRSPRKCALVQHGALIAGGLVFAWIGDPSATDQARAQLPEVVHDRFQLHRVEMDCPFYLALFNAVDYAHFAEHRFYKPLYAVYRRIRQNAHVPGNPFHWTVVGDDDRSVKLRLEEARRDLRMYITCAEFQDDGGVNHFQTFVTPLGPNRTLYWECYRARSENPVVRLAAAAVFGTVIRYLLDTEDRDWTSVSAPNFVEGRNIHLSETDAPLGAHLRRFVVPRASQAATLTA
jgi:phenylpropionate dioxygenase-like ring-hydroxylating dioxygenase large terminal subunit